MSNPNTIVAGILDRPSSSSGNRHGDLASSASTAGKLKTVYVGKNQHPISWKNKSGFDMLTSSVASLSSSHSVSDLITILDSEVPMYTYSSCKMQRKND